MDDNLNNELKKFEDKLKQLSSKDDREDLLYAKSFIAEMKKESNFEQLERKRKQRTIYLNITFLISLIVVVTLGFNQLINSCNQKHDKNKNLTTNETIENKQQETISKTTSKQEVNTHSMKLLKNLYIIGLEPLHNPNLIDKIKTLVDTNFEYKIILYAENLIPPNNFKLNNCSLADFQFNKLQWKNIGNLLKYAFYQFSNDTNSYYEIILLGNFPPLENNKIEKGLFTTKNDYKILTQMKSVNLIQIIENNKNEVSDAFATKINMLEKEFLMENAKNSIKYTYIKF